jgi:hypothetical protein
VERRIKGPARRLLCIGIRQRYPKRPPTTNMKIYVHILFVLALQLKFPKLVGGRLRQKCIALHEDDVRNNCRSGLLA